MASDVPSHVQFDFEGDMPDVSEAHPSGGGVGDSRRAAALDPDAHMTDETKGVLVH